jgi:hypothetical protein
MKTDAKIFKKALAKQIQQNIRKIIYHEQEGIYPSYAIIIQYMHINKYNISHQENEI